MSVTHVCKNCVFWEDLSKDIYTPSEFGECNIATSSNGEPKNLETLAYATDYESYYANFRTKANFSCNQFKQKDSEAP